MIRVIIESPYAGDIERNVRYARACMADSLRRGEAPFASHLLYTQPGILCDEVPGERDLGIAAGFEWGTIAELVAVYHDLGISKGMNQGISRAQRAKCAVVYRNLDEDWDQPVTTSRLVTCPKCAGTGEFMTGLKRRPYWPEYWEQEA